MQTWIVQVLLLDPSRHWMSPGSSDRAVQEN